MKRGVRALWGHNPDVLALLADRVMSPDPGHTPYFGIGAESRRAWIAMRSVARNLRWGESDGN